MKRNTPNMTLVRRWARKYGVRQPIVESELANKKLKTKTKSGRWVHFGHPDFQDFSTHRDTVRQNSYCKRAGAIRDKNGTLTGDDPESANFYAMRLLWDCTP